MRADCSGCIETNPFSCRSSQSCTAPAKSAVAPALSPRICASVNGFCVAAGAEQSEFRLLHSSRYWPTLSLIILANIDTACVVSHLYPLPPPPPMLNGVREDREREREQKTDRKNFWKGGKEWWDKEMYSHSLLCASLWCNYKWNCFKTHCNVFCFQTCEGNTVYTQGCSSPFSHAASTWERPSAPCQLERLIH